MAPLRFKPRKTFNSDLKRLAKMDRTIVEEVRAAIELLLEIGHLPPEFNDHRLNQNLSEYREFHLRDTPKSKIPNEINDVIVIYYIKEEELTLIDVRVGSHSKLF
ncbi:type II toxin-antitoxin system YafQ family toxin [Xylocopilactobacillus apicola]|uniref:Type II toxin-antitoxin system YafQ family toxin n=1 Tax=Xylocopilactobacillus apicola TaxID=2932184 RepID=A0AAU9D9L1_9LACO|nr:type II toxin-antitoxin system YafQ family toxin [Xylocopilactobacillus apicola]BDR59045.1 hypothetical protein XA3_14860 [Xylocopilactobacillus apicola]